MYVCIDDIYKECMYVCIDEAKKLFALEHV